MKKLVSLLLALAMLLSTCAMAESVADLAKAAEAMTHDELVAKAQAEGVKIDPQDQNWLDYWAAYKASCNLPEVRIMTDEEIADALAAGI